MFTNRLVWVLRRAIALVLLSAILAPLSMASAATTQPDNARLCAMIKALEQRVAVLEKQVRFYQGRVAANGREGERARLQLAALQREPGVEAPRPQTAMTLGRPVLPAPDATTPDIWSGPYWGMSFGFGLTSTRESALRSDIPNTSLTLQAIGEGEGVTVDMVLGVNKRLTPRLVAGLQVEGSVSGLDFSTKGTIT
ncbi:MAG: hypothetical protein D6773_18550, partial [Alphaproteobacteria bacterium]